VSHMIHHRAVADYVPYEPGVLQAVDYNVEGEVVAEAEVRTARESSALRLSVDREAIRTGERDVAHVTIEVVDDQGLVVPGADP